MATITNFLNGMTTAKAAFPAAGLNKVFVLRNLLDFSDVNVLASDVVQALMVPANTMVLDVICRVVVAEGATCTADVGDGSSTAGWDTGVNLNAAVGTTTQTVQGTDARKAANAFGYVYTAADTIDLVMGHNTDAAKLLITAICVDLS